MEMSFRMKKWGVVFVVALFVSSCAMPSYRQPYAAGYVERGIASWYGEDFHGRPTSSGEIYNMYDLTAAHKLMPLGTIAKITNLENDQPVVVKIKVMKWGENLTDFTVQVGSFEVEENALRLKAKLNRTYKDVQLCL